MSVFPFRRLTWPSAAATFLLVFIFYQLWATRSRVVERLPAQSSISGHVSGSSFDWSTRKQRYPVDKFTKLPTGAPRDLPRIQHAFASKFKLDATRAKRRDDVKAAFKRCWDAYRAKAWGEDEVEPLSGGSKGTFGGWAATLIDSLDTLLIMDMKAEFNEALEVVAELDFGTCSLDEINVFETTIRHMGGLMSAYDLSGERLLLDKAIEVGEMLYAAFDTPNRMPITRWDLERARTGARQSAKDTLSAEIGSLTMEFAHLSQLTGDDKWYDAVDRIMKLFKAQQIRTNLPGMWPLVVHAREEDFTTGSSFTLGAMSDSLYEYLAKTYALLGGLEPMYKSMATDALATAAKYTIYRPLNPDNLDIRMAGSVHAESGHIPPRLEPDGQHLVCFTGGMFALGGRILGNKEHVKLGRKLTDGCVWAYNASPFGMMPETFRLIPCEGEACHWDELVWKTAVAQTAGSPMAEVSSVISSERLYPGFSAINDRRYILRPEAIESVFVLYRITGDEKLLEDAWGMFTNIMEYTRTDLANAALSDVTVTEGMPPKTDSMESFWMAETLKYFYLIFSEPSLISLDDYVFNTEAHPFKLPKGARG